MKEILYARGTVHNMAGKHVAIQPCEVCQTTEHVHRHHDDYSKPLDVRFLCAKHHAQQHGAKVRHDNVERNVTPLSNISPVDVLLLQAR